MKFPDTIENQPLFILAPPRSFTSVVCAMIGQHPQTCGLPEVNLFSGDDLHHLTRWYRLRPRFRHGLLRAVAQLGLGGQSAQSIRAARQWLDERSRESTRTIYYDLVDWAAPRTLVDKSPMYVVDRDALHRIHTAFPDARYIHLTRDPRSTCESLLRLHDDIQHRGGMPAVSRPDPDSLWFKPHRRILEFLKLVGQDRQMRIQGEAFVADPDPYLVQIAEWLQLRTDREAIERMKHPEDSPFACLGPVNARFGNDPGFLENPVFRKRAVASKAPNNSRSADEALVLGRNITRLARQLGY